MRTRDELIDTHCHLDAAEFDADRAVLIADARMAGVAACVIPAIERANFGAVASVCREFAGCAPAYGIHPLYVGRAIAADLEVLRVTLRREPVVAVGEIGLDGFVEPRDDRMQADMFAAQLKIARDFDLPVLLHVRRAIDPVLKQLRRVGVRGGIAHAFNGSRQQADAFIDLGFKLGFGGAMTFAGSRRIRVLAATLPLESIVLETDAPDIPPEWRRGTRNTPGDLLPIAECLARLRGLPLTAVAAATRANAYAALPRLHDFYPAQP